jgi:hypothetical protein
MASNRISLNRFFCVLFPPFVFLGIGLDFVEAEVNQGTAGPAAFGLLATVFGLLLRPLAKYLEEVVLDRRQRPWLSGRLTPLQRMILPFGTPSVLPLGGGLAFGGASYLLESPPGGNPVNVAAVVICAAGGALTGFALSRLFVGLLIVHTSGIWSASRRAWLAGGTAVALTSLASTLRWMFVALG